MPQAIATAVDAFSRPPSAEIAAAGYQGVLCYLYNVTRAEVDRHHGVGLDVGLIAEYDTKTWHPILDGYDTGRKHGAKAAATAASIGAPAGCILWATADTDVLPSQYATASEYMRGFGETCAPYRPGIYAGDGCAEFCLDRGTAVAGWATGATSWAHGVRSQRVALRQFGYVMGNRCDHNEIYMTDWGQWRPDGSTPNLTESENDDMGATEQGQLDDIQKWIKGDGSPGSKGMGQKIDDLINLLYRDGVPAPIDLLADIDGWVKIRPDASGNVDTEAILAAIKALPAANVAAIKDAL